MLKKSKYFLVMRKKLMFNVYISYVKFKEFLNKPTIVLNTLYYKNIGKRYDLNSQINP